MDSTIRGLKAKNDYRNIILEIGIGYGNAIENFSSRQLLLPVDGVE